MANMQERLKTLLRCNGLRVTKQRVAILEVLDYRPDEHFTAEQIYDCVKKSYPEIGLATVYRTIQVLSDLKLIDKLILDDGCIRYEIGKDNLSSSTQHHHHHLICTKCGKVFTFREDLLEALESEIYKTMGFEVINHEVKLYGICKDCLKSSD